MIDAVRFSVLIGSILLLTAQTTHAQQTCYTYDEIGQLVGVVNQQGQTIIYDYDQVGNMLAIRRNDATAPVAITFVNPPDAVARTRIDILGVGFSDVPSEDQVTINGVAATVLSASICRLTVVVPDDAGAGSATITVTTPAGTASTSFPVGAGVFVAPSATEAVINITVGFFATVTGITDQRVTWSVNAIPGGNATVGTIGATGLYTAPAVLPVPPQVNIRATSVAAPDTFGEAAVTIVQQGVVVYAPPVSISFAPPPVGTIYAAPVSVSFAPPPVGTIYAAPVSVSFAPPPVGTIYAAPVSVSFAPPQVGTVYAPPVSVCKGPVITSVTPGTGAPGTTFSLTVNGANFTGATGLVFLLNGQLDSNISAGNIAVNASGDQLTANVTINAAAAVGTRVVMVQAPAGISNPQDTGNNTLRVTAQ